jgi:hypothetical protein
MLPSPFFDGGASFPSFFAVDKLFVFSIVRKRQRLPYASLPAGLAEMPFSAVDYRFNCRVIVEQTTSRT